MAVAEGATVRWAWSVEAHDIRFEVRIGLYSIVTFQYGSTTLYQFSYHIQ